MLVAAAALSACSAAPAPLAARAAAITNGSDDDGDPGVVALVQGSAVVCTATLVAPRLLLTAAHCLADGALPDADFGAVPGTDDVRVPLVATQRHPAFDAARLDNDVALALLGDDAPAGAAPYALPAGPLDAQSLAGAALRLVGYGKTAAGAATPARKRSGSSVVAALSDATFTFAPSPSQTCEGDSGGPAFATVGGVERVVGVTSSGDAACADHATDMRVDAYAAFIAPFAAATAAGAAHAGDRCWYAGNCAADAGECAPALDDATLSFCAPACAGGCPAGLACLAGSDGRRLCRHAGPSPGAAGSGCASDGDCNAGACVAPARGGARVCATRCFADLPGFCPATFDCLPISDGGDACLAHAHGGGCAMAPHAPAPRWPLLLAASLVGLRMMRTSTRRRRCKARCSRFR